MSGTEPRQSNRWVWAASALFLAILVAATLIALFWPRIELAYHRRYLRKGTPEQQFRALEWICKNRLEEGMPRAEVERILGEPMGKRFRHIKDDFFFGSTSTLVIFFERDGTLRTWLVGVGGGGAAGVYGSPGGGGARKRPKSTGAPE